MTQEASWMRFSIGDVKIIDSSANSFDFSSETTFNIAWNMLAVELCGWADNH